MLTSTDYDFCSEFYVVEKTVYAVANVGGQDRAFLIEALHAPQTGQYSTASYIKDDHTLQPTYPQGSGGFQRKPENVSHWVVYDLPWTRGNTADDVIRQALGWLRERTS